MNPALSNSLIFLLMASFSLMSRCLAGETGPREQIDLNGEWKWILLPVNTTPGTKENWKSFTAPHIVDSNAGEPRSILWMKREITIPASWINHRIIVDLRGARFDPRVFIDGKLAGGFTGGWWPGEVDISPSVTPGQTHTLQIACADWQSQLADGFVLPKGAKLEEARGKVLAPVGGYRGNIGIWDDVFLRAEPTDRIIGSSLIISPSTRNRNLTIRGTVAASNSSSVVRAIVLDDGKTALDLGEATIEKDGTFRFTSAFSEAIYWSPENPHLYQLQVTLAGKAGTIAIDQITKRFGFREVWTSGKDLYLNGVKRHLLSGSYWPKYQPISSDEIRHDLVNAKSTGCNSFRLHIGGWQEEWVNIADEIGIMIVDEIPVYTDGDGFYAYKDDRFWKNYRDCIKGMITRDRNHASVVLWSLGNEILFMGNTRHDAELPKKLGQLAQYAHELDADHPVTFEADLDPDGKFDVIGLHYPHEMPQNYAYPNTCDWLDTIKETEAAGGMLGKSSNKFYWDRKKPLYVGEYLWVPLNDYSSGTIFFGDNAYLDREGTLNAAKRLAWADQTLAYRRAGVTGMCPWGATGDKKSYYAPVAAFLHNRNLRVFAGSNCSLDFDVFNDSDQSRDFILELQTKDTTLAKKEFSLEGGGYLSVPVSFSIPSVDATEKMEIRTVLSDSKKSIFHQAAHTLQIEPSRTIAAPKGTTLIAFDPTGAWPGSVKTLDDLEKSDVQSTLLLLAPHALGQTRKTGPALVGDRSFDASQFHKFVQAGGRAIVLEQDRLSPLGLNLSLVQHASTMTFPLRSSHPILNGISESDLKFWAPDHFVSQLEIRRPEAMGGKAIIVSGGPNSLDQSPLIEMPCGQGHIVFFQALVGQKLKVEPVAQRLLQNAVNYLAQLPRASQHEAIVLSANDEFSKSLESVAVDAKVVTTLSKESLENTNLLIVHGADDAILKSSEQIKSLLLRPGTTLYWSQPSPKAFAALQGLVGAETLSLGTTPAQAPINDRESLLLTGISREDLTYASQAVSWTRNIKMQSATTGSFMTTPSPEVKPIDLRVSEWKPTNTTIQPDKAIFTRRGDIFTTVTLPREGYYSLKLTIHPEGPLEAPAEVILKANKSTLACFQFDGTQATEYSAFVRLPAGEAKLVLALTNLDEWGSTPLISISDISLIAHEPFAGNIASPLSSGALVEIKTGQSRVVLDMVDWFHPGSNRARGQRYASALLANLGASFRTPNQFASADVIPNSAFHLVAESAYYSNDRDTITLRNNGIIETEFETVADGDYIVLVRASSTPMTGEYAKVRAIVDGTPSPDIELKAANASDFSLAFQHLTKGLHKLNIEFFNDAFGNGEDRNVFIQSIQIQRK